MDTTFHVKQRGLGKGLQVLLGEAEHNARAEKDVRGDTLEQFGHITEIALSAISANPYQPRTIFSEDSLQELAQSIRDKGVLQPVTVRKLGRGKFELIMGERRLRASKIAGKQTIPAIVRDMSDQDVMETALLENIQRQDLSPIEEAEAYAALIRVHQYTQEKLAAKLGKSRPHIANLLRLLTLPDDVKQWVNDGLLSMGHARALLAVSNPSQIAKEVIDKHLSVRQTEALSAKPKTGSKSDRKKNTGKTVKQGGKEGDILTLESDLSELLGLQVSIDDQGGRGSVTIHFHTLQDLDKILTRLGQEHSA